MDASLKWIIDLTIAYPNGNPLDIMTIFFASAPPCNVVFHYRCYPISEVRYPVFLHIVIQSIPRDIFYFQIPTDNELLKQWVYDRYIEKESMLATYYSTGRFPDHRRPNEFCEPRLVVHDGFRSLLIHLLYITSTLFHWKLLTLLCSMVLWWTSLTNRVIKNNVALSLCLRLVSMSLFDFLSFCVHSLYLCLICYYFFFVKVSASRCRVPQ